MNVYCLFHYSSTYYIHKVLKSLQEDSGVDQVGGIVAGQEYFDFLDNQSQIDYEPLHCVQTVHEDLAQSPLNEDRLEELEEEFDTPTLRRYAISDRHYSAYDNEKEKKLVQNWFDFYIDVFNNFSPDLLITDAVAACNTWIAFDTAQHMGGVSVWWKHTRVQDLYSILVNDPYDNHTYIHQRYDELVNNEEIGEEYKSSKKKAENYIREIREGQTTPSYFSTDSIKINQFESVKNAFVNPLRYARWYYLRELSSSDNKFKGDYTLPDTKERIVNDIKRWYSKMSIIYGNTFSDPPESNYAFLPLHLQPEASTRVLAQPYINQISVIEQIATAIPASYNLCIKEHPNMRGERSIKYYDRIKNISGTTLVDPRIDSHTLIKGSDLVFTITNTTGLEAVINKTPVICFGKPHYKKLSSVKNGGDPKNLPELISITLQKPKIDERELLKYITAIFHEGFSIPGSQLGDESFVNEQASILKLRLRPVVSCIKSK
jgi:hypothetical protein